MADWAVSSRPETSPAEMPALRRPAVALLSSGITSISPSWERLNDLAQKRLEELRDHAGAP